MCGAPSVEHELGLSHRGYVLFAFAAPLLIAALIEAFVALLSDRSSRRQLVVAGQSVLVAALVFTARTTHPWGLAIGLAVAGAASGVACGAAQAALVVAGKGQSDRALVRWSFFAALGDVLAPLATAGAIALGASYRGALLAVAFLVAGACAVEVGFVVLAKIRTGSGEIVVMATIPRPAALPRDAAKEPSTDAPAPAEPIRAALARAVRLPRLWGWLFAAASCTLLDELVVALAALRLAEGQAAAPALATATAVTFSAGSVLGAALTDRAVARWSSRTVLVASGIACAVAIAAFVASGLTTSVLVSCVALLAVGILSAPHHALALARAYQELPDHPGSVQALTQAFVVFDIAAPLALGSIADRFGLPIAMACLGVQPVVVAACAALLGAAPRSAVPS